MCSFRRGRDAPLTVMYGSGWTPHFLENTMQELFAGFHKAILFFPAGKFLDTNLDMKFADWNNTWFIGYLDAIYIHGIRDCRWQCLSKRVYPNFKESGAQHASMRHAFFLRVNLWDCTTNSYSKCSLRQITRVFKMLPKMPNDLSSLRMLMPSGVMDLLDVEEHRKTKLFICEGILDIWFKCHHLVVPALKPAWQLSEGHCTQKRTPVSRLPPSRRACTGSLLGRLDGNLRGDDGFFPSFRKATTMAPSEA